MELIYGEQIKAVYAYQDRLISKNLILNFKLLIMEMTKMPVEANIEGFGPHTVRV